MRVAKNDLDISKDDDVTLLQDNLKKFGMETQVKDALGINDRTVVSGVIPKPGYNSQTAQVVLHELLHNYGLDDAYKTDDKGNMTDPAIGNVMGAAYQYINFTSITEE